MDLRGTSILKEKFKLYVESPLELQNWRFLMEVLVKSFLLFSIFMVKDIFCHCHNHKSLSPILQERGARVMSMQWDISFLNVSKLLLMVISTHGTLNIFQNLLLINYLGIFTLNRVRLMMFNSSWTWLRKLEMKFLKPICQTLILQVFSGREC